MDQKLQGRSEEGGGVGKKLEADADQRSDFSGGGSDR